MTGLSFFFLEAVFLGIWSLMAEEVMILMESAG
jgi:hypothetical protein